MRCGLSSGLLALALLVVLAPRPVSAAAEHEVDLIGSWHVTTHYRDSATANPDADRWEDRVWRFEERGSRLQWTEFPIVVFADKRGRFEPLDGSRPKRMLHFWEPSEVQLLQIRKGLLVNPRGSKAKGLRGRPEAGYKSVGGIRAESASVIGYSETWRIDGLPTMPVFTRDDTMGSGRTENMQGRTQYTAESVNEDGSEIRGRYGRDGTRRGTFVMRRAGSLIVMGGKGDGRKQEKR